MLDIKFVRENPDIVKENIKKKFQDHKLPMVDEVIELDAERRKTQQEADDLKAARNKISKEIGKLMAQGKRAEAEEVKKQVAADGAKIEELNQKEKELSERVLKLMMTIPILSILLYLLVRMILRMLRFSVMVSLLFPSLTFLITLRLWRSLRALIWMLP